MNQRDRLIELLLSSEPFHERDMDDDFVDGELEIVADHLLDNGVIVPPCKVGDMVYIVENPYSFLPLEKAVEGEVMSIHQHEHGLFLRVLFDTKKINGCIDYNVNWKLNKTVFLSREDAEKALHPIGPDGYPEIMRHFTEVE